MGGVDPADSALAWSPLWGWRRTLSQSPELNRPQGTLVNGMVLLEIPRPGASKRSVRRAPQTTASGGDLGLAALGTWPGKWDRQMYLVVRGGGGAPNTCLCLGLQLSAGKLSPGRSGSAMGTPEVL